MADPIEQIDKTPIYGIPTQNVMQIWDKVEPILARAVKPETDMTLQSVLNDIQLGNFHLWVIGDFKGVAVTQIQVRPTSRVAWIQFIAGDNMKDWFDDWIEAVERYAKDALCDAIEFSGRKGWNKLAQEYTDYKPVWTIFRRVF